MDQYDQLPMGVPIAWEYHQLITQLDTQTHTHRHRQTEAQQCNVLYAIVLQDPQPSFESVWFLEPGFTDRVG